MGSRKGLPVDNAQLVHERLEYAWKYFESASARRAAFLNFFLVLTGILANAYVLSIANGLWLGAVLVSLYGALASAAFIAFDNRYLTFVNRSLRVLEHLERGHYFPDDFADSEGQQLGLARIEPDESGGGRPWYAKVKFWQRWVIYGAALVCFSFGLIYAVAHRDNSGPASDSRTSIEQLEQAVDRLDNLHPRMPVENVLPPSDDNNGKPES